LKARQLEAAAEDNAILRALPPEELDRLRPFLRYTPLTVRQRLSSTSEPLTQLWFPLEGAVSRLVHLPTGETVEAGIVGNDGAIGLPLALGGNHWLGVATVQIGGTALCISAVDFDEQVRATGSPLAAAMMRYANLYISVLSQLTACHALHRIEQRLSRCILTLLDYSGMPAVQITHDTLADFLGVHRPSVTYALQSIAESGAIVSERRRIVVRDRQALLGHSCDCYTAIRTSTDRELEAMAQSRRRS
jgi:CRP-like cAMP-binding protein